MAQSYKEKVPSWVSNWVECTLSTGETLRGILYSVDPEQGHLLLLNNTRVEGTWCPMLLFNNHVVDVQVLADQPECKLDLECNDIAIVMGEKLATQTNNKGETDVARKQELKHFLESNHLPVEEQGDCITVLGCVKILPPYTPAHCQSTNTIALGKIQSLLENFGKPLNV